MATNSQIATSEGTGKNIATYSISELTTKELQRNVLSTSAGVEAGTAASPIQVSLANTATNAVAVKVDGSGVTQPISIATNTPILTPTTSGGLTVSHTVSAASTNATVIKASAGQVYGWYIYNSNTSARKVVFHNASTTPTAGASVFYSLMIPPTAGANVFGDIGIPFSTGIAMTMVTGLADSDATAVALNDLVVNIFYK